MNKLINLMSEFDNKKQENEFFQEDMQNTKNYIKPVILILGILDTLFLIPDYLFVKDIDSFIIIAAGRMLFILTIIIFYLMISKIKNSKNLALVLTIFEFISVLLFLFVLYQYKTPNYLIQSYGVLVILLAFFMVPNRLINMIIVSSFASLAFVLMSMYYIKNIKSSEFYAGIVYIAIFNFLFSIMAWRNNYNKRIQYLNGKELLRLSTVDSLTGAYNRLKFDEELKEWTGLSKRYSTPLSLIILDFDNFKKINDTYGHLVGDNVLIESVRLFKSCIRETDIFARWGGEEFTILLPNTDLSNATNLAERLRSKIANYKFKDVGQVTCSFGVANMNFNDNIENFLQKVDKMLYVSKNSGKNQVKKWQD